MATVKTRLVDGEHLTARSFLIVGHPQDTETWKLPWKFSTWDKRVQHCKNNLRRFNEVAGASPEARRRAWRFLRLQARYYLPYLSSDPGILRHLNSDQLFDLQRRSVQAQAAAVIAELAKEGLVTKTVSV